MESNSPSQTPNGSVGVDARPPDSPPHNGNGRPHAIDEQPAAAAVPAPLTAPAGDAALGARPRGRYYRYAEDAAAIAAKALDALAQRLRTLSAALVRQAAGRPLTLKELRAPAPARAPAARLPNEAQAGFSIVVIERDDPLPAICGKIDGARLSQVAVLVPRGNYELSTEVGARLLLRHAEWSGKEIVLVTRRPAVRQVAHAEGLRYVGSLQHVPFGRARSPLLGGLELPAPAASTIAWLAGVCLVGLLAAAVVFWYVPSATVTLFPATERISQEQSLSLDPVANRVDSVNNVVPADRRSVAVTRTVLLPVTGSVSIDQAAGDPATVPAVSDADLKTAHDLAAAALTEAALQQLNARDDGGWVYFAQTAKVDVQGVEPQQQPGVAAPFLQVNYRGTVSMLGARQSDLRALILGGMHGKVAAGKQIIDSSERLTVEKAGPYDVTVDRLPLVMRLDAATSGQVDVAKIEHALRGKTRRQALEYAAQALDGVHEPSLRLSPSWAPWLPHFGSRLHVELAARD